MINQTSKHTIKIFEEKKSRREFKFLVLIDSVNQGFLKHLRSSLIPMKNVFLNSRHERTNMTFAKYRVNI